MGGIRLGRAGDGEGGAISCSPVWPEQKSYRNLQGPIYDHINKANTLEIKMKIEAVKKSELMPFVSQLKAVRDEVNSFVDEMITKTIQAESLDPVQDSTRRGCHFETLCGRKQFPASRSFSVKLL